MEGCGYKRGAQEARGRAAPTPACRTPTRLPQAADKAGGSSKKQQRRRSSEAASTAELQLAGLLQLMHLLANPPPEPAPGASPGAAAAAEEEREVVPLAREVVAQVVDALFDRWVA